MSAAERSRRATLRGRLARMVPFGLGAAECPSRSSSSVRYDLRSMIRSTPVRGRIESTRPGCVVHGHHEPLP